MKVRYLITNVSLIPPDGKGKSIMFKMVARVYNQPYYRILHISLDPDLTCPLNALGQT